MTSENSLIKVGGRVPFYGGASARIFDLKGHNEISQIFVSVGELGIVSVQFQYLEKGNYVLSEKYGSDSYAKQFHTIELNHPAEYITGVCGQYSTCYQRVLLITFTSNLQKYGPFGLTELEMNSRFPSRGSFTYNLGKSCQFGGFHGFYNSSGLSSIGFYLSVKTVSPSSSSKILKKET